MCRDVSVCPPQADAAGAPVAATRCTTSSLVPTAEELDAGKSISCTCGGDAATEQLCQARLLHAAPGSSCGLHQ